MANAITRRRELEKRERLLHEQLADHTRRLQMARVHLKNCEDALEQTLNELHIVKQEKKKVTGMLESMWNGPAGQQTKRPTEGGIGE